MHARSCQTEDESQENNSLFQWTFLPSLISTVLLGTGFVVVSFAFPTLLSILKIPKDWRKEIFKKGLTSERIFQ